MQSKTVYHFSFILRNCVPLSAICHAKQTHAQILIHGLLSNATLRTDLLLAYSKCGFLQDARKLVDKMAEINMHSWNILISSYTNSSMCYEAVCIYDNFLKMGFRPDHYTLPPLFKACARMGDIYLGKTIHGWVIRFGFEQYVVVGGSLLYFYVKSGSLSDAQLVFWNLVWRDSVVWNSMISGLERAGLYVEALNCFRNMLDERVKFDSMTIPSILSACGGEGDLIKGKEVHGQVVKSLLSDGDVAIGNSLIDMYAKCGGLLDSAKVFKNMRHLNLVTWTTMISSYGVHGKGEQCLILFNKMRDCGFTPNCVTLTAILASCSHSGLIDQGRAIFNSISSDYDFEPSVEHYACLVHLLGRSGHLEEAVGLVKNMKLEVAPSVWGALLSSCVMHKNVEIGELAAHHLFELEPRNPSNYIALCSIYDSLGIREGVSATRARINQLGLVKNPGCSWIYIAGKACLFYQGDESHPLTRMIHETLHGILKMPMLHDN